MRSGERPDPEPEVDQQLEELRTIIATNRMDIDALQAESQHASDRADASEVRAEVDRQRVAGLQEQMHLDHALVAVLQAEGVLKDEHIANLEVALATSRQIGAAIGITMAAFKVDESEGFAMLRVHSQNTNQKLRELAADIVLTGDVSALRLERPARSEKVTSS